MYWILERVGRVKELYLTRSKIAVFERAENDGDMRRIFPAWLYFLLANNIPAAYFRSPKFTALYQQSKVTLGKSDDLGRITERDQVFQIKLKVILPILARHSP
jgi:hypothetical protein